VPDVLVGGQLALSLALLVAAALFVRAGAAAAIADPGYTLRDGLLVQTDLDMIGATRADGLRIYGDLVDRLRALPGVRAATVASVVPFGDYRDGRMVRARLDPDLRDLHSGGSRLSRDAGTEAAGGP
jgi:hypothetical protein